MNSRTRLLALGSGLLLGVAGVVHAETTANDADLKAQVAALQSRVQELEGKKGEAWLNEQRASEVKALVKEVLADADTRASLAGNGMTAGHNGKNFYLASEDGNFLMNISGQIQVRYIYNHRRDVASLDEGDDENENGFSIPRAKIQFDGHVFSPAWTYVLRLNGNREDTEVFAEEATIGYRVMDNLNVRVGRSKSPFLREELTSSAYQLTVERSLVNSIFTAGYTEGLYVNWDATDMIRVSGSIDDGDFSGEGDGANDFNTDLTDIAFGGRVDVKLAGDWKQMQDFSAWSGEDLGIFVGAAVRYGVFETGDFGTNDKILKWTVDGSVETNGFNIYAAFIGAHFNGDDHINNVGDSYGAVVQAGYMVIPDKLEPFGRYEWINVDADSNHDRNHVFTAGVNYYIAKHAAKFTIDAVYVLNPLDTGVVGSGASVRTDNSNLGLLSDSAHGDQVAVRAQVQLLF
jgi:hypothetical protein